MKTTPKEAARKRAQAEKDKNDLEAIINAPSVSDFDLAQFTDMQNAFETETMKANARGAVHVLTSKQRSYLDDKLKLYNVHAPTYSAGGVPEGKPAAFATELPHIPAHLRKPLAPPGRRPSS